jgi:hypothetical protein
MPKSNSWPINTDRIGDGILVCTKAPAHGKLLIGTPVRLDEKSFIADPVSKAKA